MSWVLIAYLVGTVVGAVMILRHWRTLMRLKLDYWPRYEVRCTHTMNGRASEVSIPLAWAEVLETLTRQNPDVSNMRIIDRWTGSPVIDLPSSS
jgi:hypothetical protein